MKLMYGIEYLQAIPTDLLITLFTLTFFIEKKKGSKVSEWV